MRIRKRQGETRKAHIKQSRGLITTKMLNIEKLSTTTNYTIYLKNEGADGKNFWCFSHIYQAFLRIR